LPTEYLLVQLFPMVVKLHSFYAYTLFCCPSAVIDLYNLFLRPCYSQEAHTVFIKFINCATTTRTVTTSNHQNHEMENVVAQNPPVYKLTHERLAPLRSGEDDAPAAAVIAGSEVQDAHCDAAYTQHMYRKALQTMGLATTDEVKDSWNRKTMILVDNKVPLPAGEDFAQRVFIQLNSVQAGMQDLTNKVEGLTNKVEGLTNKMTQVAIQTAKNANRALLRLETLVPVPNNDGNLPDQRNFPRTFEDLMNMEARNVNRLLVFYDISTNRDANLNARKELLCRHLGIVVDRLS
jgi:Protein of unknown function (DUF3294)